VTGIVTFADPLNVIEPAAPLDNAADRAVCNLTAILAAPLVKKEKRPRIFLVIASRRAGTLSAAAVPKPAVSAVMADNWTFDTLPLTAPGAALAAVLAASAPLSNRCRVPLMPRAVHERPDGASWPRSVAAAPSRGRRRVFGQRLLRGYEPAVGRVSFGDRADVLSGAAARGAGKAFRSAAGYGACRRRQICPRFRQRRAVRAFDAVYGAPRHALPRTGSGPQPAQIVHNLRRPVPEQLIIV
jgi:hypothetical protein